MYSAATCSAYAYCHGTSSCGAGQLWTGREALWSTLLSEATLCSTQSSLCSGGSGFYSRSQLAFSPQHYNPYGSSYAPSQLYAYPTLLHQLAAGAEFQTPTPTATQATAPPAAQAVMPTGNGTGIGGPPRPLATATRPTARKERRRTANLNAAFAKLRERIPNLPPDTKLPKIKTLRRAADYIRYLSGLLEMPLPPPSPSRAASDTASGPQVSEGARDVTLCAAGADSGQTLEQRSEVSQSSPTAPKTITASPTLTLPSGSFLAQLEDSSDSAMWPFLGAVDIDAVLWQTTDQLQSAQTEILVPTKSVCATSEQSAASCTQEATRRSGGGQRSGWPEAMWKQSLDCAGAALPSGSPPSASASLPLLPCGQPSPKLPTAAGARHAYEFEQLI